MLLINNDFGKTVLTIKNLVRRPWKASWGSNHGEKAPLSQPVRGPLAHDLLLKRKVRNAVVHGDWCHPVQTAADATRKPGMQGTADLWASEGVWCETKGRGRVDSESNSTEASLSIEQWVRRVQENAGQSRGSWGLSLKGPRCRGCLLRD